MNKRDRFEKALEDLVVMAIDSDFYIDFNEVKNTTVDGSFGQRSKKIEVNIGPSAPTEDILFVTAHEVRHMQHYKLGIYKDYYREDHEHNLNRFSKTDILPIGYVPPKPCVAIRAESDCNKWAKAFMKQRGFDYEPTKYRIRNVMGYAAWIRYQTIKRQRNQKAPSSKGAAC
jgi:hypothetical protein